MLKYRVEIQADTMESLIHKIINTGKDLARDPEYVKRIENKGMESIFFTRYSNILIVDSKKEDN